MNPDKMGVYVLMSHLLITLAIIVVYAYTLISGNQDDTLKTVLTVIVGYWFGSMGGQMIKKGQDKINQQKTEKGA